MSDPLIDLGHWHRVYDPSYRWFDPRRLKSRPKGFYADCPDCGGLFASIGKPQGYEKCEHCHWAERRARHQLKIA